MDQVSQISSGPIAPAERLEAMDFLRGVAIFGILMVNMAFFALPFMEAIYPQDYSAWSGVDRAGYLFVKVLFEFKFVSMFSLLFGAGLVMQWTRARTAGSGFAGRYYRRIALLAAFGLVHGLLLWYGDILFIYACVGSILYFFRGLRPRTLLYTAGALLIVTMILSVSLLALEMASEAVAESPSILREDSQGQISGAADEGSPRGFDAMAAAAWDPAGEEWVAGERIAYREGPFADAMAYRVVSFTMALVFTLIGFGWHIMAMFLVGAAFMKMQFFSRERRALQARVAMIFLPLGLLLEVTNALVTTGGVASLGWEDAVGAVLHEMGAASLCLGYVGVGALIATAARGSGLLSPIRAVGRMALTAYLLSTLVTTFLMYHWGLGWFGTLGRAELVMLVPVIYAGLAVVCVVWLRLFRFGPFEWLWRSVTYLRAQPMLREMSGG